MPSLDVLIVGLGATHGLRAAEDELAGAMLRAGADVMLTRAARPREVRTLALTDLVWARAARRAAVEALADSEPRAIVYSTTTAALLWPPPGAIRFDAPAAANRPGRHGIWQRPVEARRLRESSLLIPQDPGALVEAGSPAVPALVVPIPVEPSGDGETGRSARHRRADLCDQPLQEGVRSRAGGVGGGARARARSSSSRACADPIARASATRGRWSTTRSGRCCGGRKVYVTAPRREDYGIAQLEALADGARVVTTPSPGPYAALPLLRRDGLGWVAEPDAATLGAGAARRPRRPDRRRHLRRARAGRDRPLPPRDRRRHRRRRPPPTPPRPP